MSKKKLHIKPNVTVDEFIAGMTLIYMGVKFKKTEATYRIGVGVILTRDDSPLGTVLVVDDHSARRLYHNLTRKPTSQEEPDDE